MIPKNEFRVFGPPGTGKTTWLRRQVKAAVSTHGPESVLVTSFTRAAAENLVQGDGLSVSKNSVGTLHSLCYRLLGAPTIAETKAQDWNEWLKSTGHPKAKEFSLDGTRPNVDDPYAEESSPEQGSYLFDIGLLRNRMVPQDGWPAKWQEFSTVWEQWKREMEYIDFTDMVERAFQNWETYPDPNKQILFVDEAQDLVPLHFALIRKWGAGMEKFVLVGDDDQTLYEWLGASPNALLEDIDKFDDEQVIQLKQSWRVPSAPHALAEKIVARIPESRRYVKAYKPTPHEGSVKNLRGTTFQNPHGLLASILEELKTPGRSIMVLASCNYLLAPTMKALKDVGVPFWNPYRPQKPAWNPLGVAKRGVTSSLKRFQALVNPSVGGVGGIKPTLEEIELWASILKATAYSKRGVRKDFLAACKRNPKGDFMELFGGSLNQFWIPELEDSILEGNPLAFRGHWDTAKKPIMEYLTRIWDWEGPEFFLAPTPRVCIGTIHSVKGGEADSVYIWPDLSVKGALSLATEGLRDQIYRQFYVAITRTRDRLTLLPGASHRKIAL